MGGRWGTLEALHEGRPDLALVATDVHAHRLENAPGWVQAVRDDVTEPRPSIYRGAQLLYAVRCPEELQVPLARLASSLQASLAVQALKDEWVALDGLLGAHELLQAPDGRPWRWWRVPGSR